MIRIENVSLSTQSFLKNIGGTQKRKGFKWPNKNNLFPKGDELKHSEAGSRSAEERTKSAVMKSNEANKERLIAEINRSGEIDSVYDKLLLEYGAYKNPEINDLVFTPISSDTIIVKYKG